MKSFTSTASSQWSVALGGGREPNATDDKLLTVDSQK